MHIPDGIMTTEMCSVAGVAAAGALGYAALKSPVTTTARQREMIPAVAAVIFAAQMVNMPIGGGTSGHLIGGALAATLVGPVAAMAAMTAVVATQALIFGDGGLAALGINLLLLAVIPTLSGAALSSVLRRVIGADTHAAHAARGAIAAFGSVMAAVVGYLVMHEVGATVAFSGRSIASAMVTTHLGVAFLEALISAAAIVAIRMTLPEVAAAGAAPVKEARVKAVVR